MPVLLIPAPPGTYILHIVRASDDKLAILKHVCVGFSEIERGDDKFMVPRCLIPAGNDVIEAAVLHPTGEVSSTSRRMSFENVDSFAFTLRASEPPLREPAKAVREPGKPSPGRKRRSAAEVAEDAARGQSEDLIG